MTEIRRENSTMSTSLRGSAYAQTMSETSSQSSSNTATGDFIAFDNHRSTTGSDIGGSSFTAVAGGRLPADARRVLNAADVSARACFTSEAVNAAHASVILGGRQLQRTFVWIWKKNSPFEILQNLSSRPNAVNVFRATGLAYAFFSEKTRLKDQVFVLCLGLNESTRETTFCGLKTFKTFEPERWLLTRWTTKSRPPITLNSNKGLKIILCLIKIEFIQRRQDWLV